MYDDTILIHNFHVMIGHDIIIMRLEEVNLFLKLERVCPIIITFTDRYIPATTTWTEAGGIDWNARVAGGI